MQSNEGGRAEGRGSPVQCRPGATWGRRSLAPFPWEAKGRPGGIFAFQGGGGRKGGRGSAGSLPGLDRTPATRQAVQPDAGRLAELLPRGAAGFPFKSSFICCPSAAGGMDPLPPLSLSRVRPLPAAAEMSESGGTGRPAPRGTPCLKVLRGGNEPS